MFRDKNINLTNYFTDSDVPPSRTKGLCRWEYQELLQTDKEILIKQKAFNIVAAFSSKLIPIYVRKGDQLCLILKHAKRKYSHATSVYNFMEDNRKIIESTEWSIGMDRKLTELAELVKDENNAHLLSDPVYRVALPFSIILKASYENSYQKDKTGFFADIVSALVPTDLNLNERRLALLNKFGNAMDALGTFVWEDITSGISLPDTIDEKIMDIFRQVTYKVGYDYSRIVTVLAYEFPMIPRHSMLLESKWFLDMIGFDIMSYSYEELIFSAPQPTHLFSLYDVITALEASSELLYS